MTELDPLADPIRPRPVTPSVAKKGRGLVVRSGVRAGDVYMHGMRGTNNKGGGG